jgi:hypothetical protein
VARPGVDAQRGALLGGRWQPAPGPGRHRSGGLCVRLAVARVEPLGG